MPGHWEGDLVFGSRMSRGRGPWSSGHTRFVMLVGLPNGHTADAVADALFGRLCCPDGFLNR